MNILKKVWPYSGLPKEIYILFFARVINSMGNFVFPFLVFFLTEKIGLSESRVGFYRMIAAMVSVPGTILGGFLSDYVERKKIFIVSQALAAIFIIPCAFLGDSIFVAYLLIIATFFGGAAPPANSAMITDLTNQKNRKQAYALLYLGINIGFAIGPLIAGFLYNNYLKLLFLGDAITTFISLILVAIFVKDTKPTKNEIEESYNLNNEEKSEKGNVLVVFLKRPSLLAFSAISIIISFVYAQSDFGIPLQIKEIFGYKGPKYYGVIMTTNALVVVGFTTIVINITKKIRPVVNIMIALILYAIGFGMIYFIHDFYMFIFSTVIWSIGEIIAATNSGVYIANHTPMSHRGRFNSILPLIIGSGRALSPVVMGLFIEIYGIRMIWPVIFILSLFAIFLMYNLYLFEKNN
ncbi:Predicted arabinose efflux permease, MFS family [Caminicella sporogenes DSM 14501]|uniref:Predicted arabinose efflux permease, MFS family n=1 Tax=Caminicella sporogenes DSM 14501 TaxID=1121266 RepID=A0A1M6S815_9FIRM|nr:MFS transporter [Caminicella sporogenes]RKD26906.1 MFS transporter [Caminicella sporogenes]WIF95890.1 MFS transporter [Caminicella sporogenes]SHK40845.1 Predicted arabinose efflux permease, MFS family [Caminicella sporogenes DSM 14501]